MKVFKITLAVLVVAAIGAGIIFWIQSIKEPEKVKAEENQSTRNIKEQIEQLKALPDNKFCKDFYKVVSYNINEFYKPSPPKHPFGWFGKNQSENDLLKESLEKELYATYADKFIKQAKTILSGSEWNPADLRFIQAEKNELKNSKLLEPGNHRNDDFSTIQTALDKYNEIVSFISSCNSFSFSGTDLVDRFPIADVQRKIQRAASLRNNRLENGFVNNCSRLHDDLKEIPQSLFRAHVRYLDDKISYWSGMYSNYNSQSDYANNLYKPLKAEVDMLDVDIYNVSNFDSEYNRLTKKLNNDSSKATQYFLNRK